MLRFICRDKTFVVAVVDGFSSFFLVVIKLNLKQRTLVCQRYCHINHIFIYELLPPF